MDVDRGIDNFIAFAAGPNRVSLDGLNGSKNGLFTEELLKVVVKPGLTIVQVFDQVRKTVYERSEHKQLPWAQSSLTSDFRLLNTPSLSFDAENRRSDSDFPQSLKQQSKNLQTLYAEADSFFQKGQYREAEELLNAAIQKEPGDPGLFHLRGQVRSRRKEHELAIQDFEQEMKLLRPDSDRFHLVYHERGVAYWRWERTIAL